jgi:hypothetical protein
MANIQMAPDALAIGPDFHAEPGQILEVPEARAASLVDAGRAIRLDVRRTPGKDAKAD